MTAKEFTLPDDDVGIPKEDIKVKLINYGSYERVNISFIKLGSNEGGWYRTALNLSADNIAKLVPMLKDYYREMTGFKLP